MTKEQLEDLAFQRKPLPADLRSQAQILLFLHFRNLYDYAERTKMPPAQGRREKHEILKAYEINKALEEMQEGTNNMWARIEIAAHNYAKSPSVETADKLYEAIYQVKRKIKVGDGIA